MQYTQSQLDEILAAHAAWLRGEAGGQRAAVAGANLSDAILSGADLRYANMRYANLSDAILSDANLSCAVLRSANLSGAVLRNANLSGAVLRNAILSGADLFGADLSGANLRWCIGNGAEIKTLQPGKYHVVYTSDVMAVGCQQHTLADWWAFDAATIAKMDDGALEWWRVWKPILQQIINVSTRRTDTMRFRTPKAATPANVDRFTVRLPHDLNTQLQARARRHGRSANTELVAILTAAMSTQPHTGESQ